MMYANASVEITMEEKHNDLTEIIVHALKDWMNIYFIHISTSLMDSIPNILWQMPDMVHITIIFSVNRTELKSI